MIQNIKNLYHLLQALAANIWYGFPGWRLKVIGVTGTSGKTTTAHLIYHILKSSGRKVALVSSVAAYIGDRPYDTGFHVTTPDPWVLPKYLKMAKTVGAEYFVLEVSSHALDQNRTAFIPFKVGVLTTMAHEHLDYHKTFQKYAEAKFKLLYNAQWIVLPVDVIKTSSPDIEAHLNFLATKKKMITFGLHDADESQKKWQLRLTIPGKFNLKNALAAAAAARILGMEEPEVKQALTMFTGVAGRFEEVESDSKFRVIIDFAHKPDALEALLRAARQEVKKNGRIIVMFGCASERDTLKRPIMGRISGKLAEMTILTDEDPRREEPRKILDEIAQGCLQVGAVELDRFAPKKEFNTNKKHVFFKITDRQEAINFIIRDLARRGDMVFLCGKGHEQSMNYRGVERPWSEHDAVKKALALRQS